MLDLIVGLVIFCFIFLGAREGIVKSLASVALVFVSLFLATNAISVLSNTAPQFKDPAYAGTIGLFFLIWAVSYIFLDLLTMLLFRRVIRIIVLGQTDIIGGLFVGGFKGLLICGIVLQLFLSLPVSDATRENVVNSLVGRLSLSTYKLTYPYVKNIVPKMRITNTDKINLMEEMGTPKSKLIKRAGEEEPDALLRDATNVPEKLLDRSKSIRKLLEEKKLVPGVPEEK